MTEGGYNPENTNPFDTHGDDHDDGDDNEEIPLLPFSKEKPPSHKYPRGTSTPIQHSSTSAHHNPSFVVDSADVGLLANIKELQREEANEKIKYLFPQSNERGFFARIEDGEVTVSLTERKDNVHYRIISEDGIRLFDDKYRVFHNGKRVQLPPKLRKALGKSIFETMDENVGKIEAKEKKIRDLDEQIANTEGEERNRKIEEQNALQDEQNALIEQNQAIEERLTLRQRIKEISKKHGLTVVAVATAIATVIGVIVSNLKAGLTKVAKGLGNGLKELGKKLGEILPGMIGAIASFIFRTAGEVIGFLAKNAWLLIVGLVVLAVERFKKKGK